MIEVKNLLKIFNKNKSNEVRAINDVSVEFPEKGLVAIYGASGSGKTTLMNALGGLDKFDGGEIIMNGNVYTKAVDDKYRIENIGYIFQNYLLDERLDVYQNVAQGLRSLGVRDEEIIFKRVMTALDNVGMREYYKREVSTLSGGQQQRVAIARAMVKGARIILADEPTGNLDEINTRIVMDLLKALSANCLVIVVTHEGDLIDKYADSVIEIKDGRIERQGVGANLPCVTTDKTRIFLKDKKKREIQAGKIHINYYGEEEPVNFTVVNEKGKLYLKIDGDVKCIGDDSEINLVDKTEKQFIEEQNVKTTKSIESFTAVQAGKPGRMFSFRNAFVSGLKSLFNKQKRVTLLAAAVIVFMIAIVIFMGVLGTHIYKYENCGTAFSSELVRMTVPNAEERDRIKSFIAEQGFEVQYEYVESFMSGVMFEVVGFETFMSMRWHDASCVYDDISKVKDERWIYGSEDDIVSYTDVVITKEMADKVLANWLNQTSIGTAGVDYTMFSNMAIVLDSRLELKIVGIVDNSGKKIYMNDLLWINGAFGYRLDEYYGAKAKDGELLVPADSTIFDEYDTVTIYGKEFSLTKSELVEEPALNAAEMRALVDRFDDYMEYHIISSEAEKIAQSLKENDIISNVKTRHIMYENDFESIRKKIKSFAVIDAILISIMLIAAFFMFYASLASKAKEIGLYRAIGVSSGNILFKFFIESLALILVCVVSVYLVIGLPVLIFSDGSAMYFPLWLYFASMLGIIVCMSAVSVLPIISFIRKTPVEILSKYDV